MRNKHTVVASIKAAPAPAQAAEVSHITRARQTVMVKVTPSLARQWLESNKKNRPVRKSHVEALRGSFARGEYVTTHQGIAFDTDGELVDGQHRLLAIAGLPDDTAFEMLVTWGMDRKAVFPVVDTLTAPRSVSDAAAVTPQLAAVAAVMARVHRPDVRGGLTPQFMAPYLAYVKDDYDALIGFCGRSVAIWSSAPVRAAAILSMKEYDRDYAMRMYRALVLSDYSAMSPVIQALNRSRDRNVLNTQNQPEVLARAFAAFNPAHSGRERVVAVNLQTPIQDARRILQRDIGGATE